VSFTHTPYSNMQRRADGLPQLLFSLPDFGEYCGIGIQNQRDMQLKVLLQVSFHQKILSQSPDRYIP
jgi:hypothetical protein